MWGWSCTAACCTHKSPSLQCAWTNHLPHLRLSTWLPAAGPDAEAGGKSSSSSREASSGSAGAAAADPSLFQQDSEEDLACMLRLLRVEVSPGQHASLARQLLQAGVSNTDRVEDLRVLVAEVQVRQEQADVGEDAERLWEQAAAIVDTWRWVQDSAGAAGWQPRGGWVGGCVLEGTGWVWSGRCCSSEACGQESQSRMSVHIWGSSKLAAHIGPSHTAAHTHMLEVKRTLPVRVKCAVTVGLACLPVVCRFKRQQKGGL